MNPNTGHLVSLDPQRLKALEDGYHTLPAKLEAAAQKELAGRNEAHVDLRKNGPLQAWAKKKRKAKIAAKSRRINRS